MVLNLPTNDNLLLPTSCEGVFSPQECQTLIELPCQQSKLAEIKGAGHPDQTQFNLKKRYTHMRLVDPLLTNKWIFDRLTDVVSEVNQAVYQARLTGLAEVHLLEYPVNGFYDWHTDLGRGSTSTRKLSVITLLSDPRSYEGGKLVIGTDMPDLPVSQGTVIVFPSYLLHRVGPVTSGQRFSMVTWFHGPFFC